MAGRTRKVSNGDQLPSNYKRTVEHDSDSEEEEEAIPPRRRPGKEPMHEDTDEEDYIPGDGDEEDARANDTDTAASKEDEDAYEYGEEEAGPSTKRRRTATAKAAQKSKKPVEATRARNFAANGGGGGGDGGAGGGAMISHDGPNVVSSADVSRLQNKITQYNNEAESILDRITGALMTQAGLNILTRHVVRFVLFSHMEKPNVPIPRDRLTKLISENSPAAAKKAHVSSYVIALAQARMAESFGLDMVEIIKPPAGKPDRSALATQGKGTQQYVLRSLVPAPLYEAVIDDGKEHAQRGFLAAIMGILDLAGGSMSQDDLWRHLNDLGVSRNTGHPKLGVPGTLLEEFIKRRQLTMHRQAGHDGPEVIYNIGENASSEVGGNKLKAFLEAELGGEEEAAEES